MVEKIKKDIDLEKVEKIRAAGKLKDIETVIELIRKDNESDAGKAAHVLLGDIKDKAVIPIILSALQKTENKHIQRELIQACWESRLDYSEHLPFFVDMFLSLDYVEALEAFTLIENTFLDFPPPTEMITDLVIKIKSVLMKLPEHKQNLAMELLHAIQG